VTDRDSLNENK